MTQQFQSVPSPDPASKDGRTNSQRHTGEGAASALAVLRNTRHVDQMVNHPQADTDSAFEPRTMS